MTRSPCLAIVLFALGILLAQPASAAPANYARPCQPVVKPAFLPLPVGSVEPAGWLRDWAVAARQGITGHLDEYHSVYHDAWKGPGVQGNGMGPDGTGWPLEQCSYWLDGAIRLGLILHDESLIKKIRARLDPIVEGVNKADPGATFIYWKKGYKPQGFNSWAHSQMGRALVALYQGTGDKRVLDALVKVYADYPAKMGEIDFNDVRGVCNLDAMLETYSYSGDRRILDRAEAAIAQPEVANVLRLWRLGNVSPGHTVILCENIRLPALVYPWTGDRSQLLATLNAFRWLETNNMLPYGVPSGQENVCGIGAFRKTETCDVTAYLLLTSWLYRIQGDGDWGDRMERAFFNAAAAPIARDFKTMCYYQSPNRIGGQTLPQFLNGGGDTNWLRFSKLGFPNVLCCVGACNRILPYYIQHMWMGTEDNGLAATLYGPSTVSALAGQGVPTRLTTTTNYPFDETIRIAVDPEKDAEFPLYLRVPAWCNQPQITDNGEKSPTATCVKGFVKVARRWSKGDVVELRLPMAPRVERGYETEFPAANRQYYQREPDAVFQLRRLPYASVVYGPLLFALPIRDIDPNTPAKGAKWQYALDVEAWNAAHAIQVERKAMPAHWDWPLDGPLVLTAPARSIDWKPSDAQPLPNGPVVGTSSETIRLVPYGCTKFRISMFPVTPRMVNN